MPNVIHRQIDATLPIAVRGEGPYLFDSTGKRYIDGSGGAAVTCLGYSHPAVIRAIQAQVATISYVHSSFFTTESLEELGALLTSWAPVDLRNAYFVSGGSEAVEAALMAARQYFVEKGDPQRFRVIGRRNAYHGMTMGALAAGDTPARRAPYLPMLMDVIHISPCFPYRGQRADESEEQYGLRVANELEDALIRCGPETVAAFVAETVIGSNNGAVPAARGYFKRIREICDQYGILLILDEVFCGVGRTGTFFAFEQEGIEPDLVAVAKGLGAGYQPIGATLIADRVLDVIRTKSGALAHGHTFGGHATACAAAAAVLKVIRSDSLLDNVTQMGASLSTALHERLSENDNVGDIRGRGLLQAVEIVVDKVTKEPFDPSLKLHVHMKAAAMDNGLMCYPQGGTIDGQRGDHITLAPAFIVEEGHVIEIAEKVSRAIVDGLARALS